MAVQKGTKYLAAKIKEKFDKEQKYILVKYAYKIIDLVQKYLGNNGLTFELEDGYRYLVPLDVMINNGKSGFWMDRAARYTSGDGDLITHTSGKKYAQGVTYSITKEDGRIRVSIHNISMPRKARWGMGKTEPINERSLTKWIVGDGEESHIHPTPPWGTWFPKEDWNDLWYKAQPYFDEIIASPEYKKIIKNLSDELSETYTEILNKEKKIYQAQQLAGRQQRATWFQKK